MTQSLVFEDKFQNSQICDTCLHEMEDSIHRIVYFQDPEKSLVAKRFHFFFPCWDMEYISQKYFEHKIVSAGFSCEKIILMDSKKIKSLQRNFSLWE